MNLENRELALKFAREAGIKEPSSQKLQKFLELCAEHFINVGSEVMRERCAKHLESCAQSFAEEYGHDALGCLSFGSGAAAELRMNTFNGWMEDAEAIRALPGITLKDIT